jgi:hypothetical protein
VHGTDFRMLKPIAESQILITWNMAAVEGFHFDIYLCWGLVFIIFALN